MIVNLNQHGVSHKGTPVYNYTGTSSFVDEGNGNWHIEFLTSGTLTFSKLNSAYKADIQCVGGGAGGQNGRKRSNVDPGQGGNGGGGGSVSTSNRIKLKKGISYYITIGNRGDIATNGGDTSFSSLVSASGGSSAWGNGGAGGYGTGNGSNGANGPYCFDGKIHGSGGGGGSGDQSDDSGFGGEGAGNGGRIGGGYSAQGQGNGGGGGGFGFNSESEGGYGSKGIAFLRNAR